MILLLGGTTEGRCLADYLHKAGFELLLSTATAFRAPGANSALTARTGPLDEAGMADLIEESNVNAVIDATHPFAEEVSRVARRICGRSKRPYVRFERAASTLPDHPNVTIVDGLQEVATACSGRVFLSTGAKTVGRYAGALTPREIFARVLPWPESLTEALRWLPADRIIAAVGPFSIDFNKACFRLFNADTLVTKDSGAGAGVEDKVAAALELDMKVVVIRRPAPDPDIFTDFEQVETYLRGALNG